MVVLLGKTLHRTFIQPRLLLTSLVKGSYSTSADIYNENDDVGFGFTSEDLANAKLYTDIPGPRDLPIVGNMFSFKPFGDLPIFDRLSRDIKLYERYGPVSRLSFPLITPLKLLVVLDPDDFEIVYRNESRYPFRNVDNTIMKNYRESRNQDLGLLLTNGGDWWKFRQPFNKIMMKANAAHPYMRIQDQIGNELVNNIKMSLKENGNNQHSMIMEDMFRWALESVCAIVFDKRLGCMDADLKFDSWQQEFINSVHQCFQLLTTLMLNPMYRLYDKVGYKSKKQILLEKCMDYISDTSHRLILEGKENMDANSEIDLSKTFLYQLLNIETLTIDQKVSVIFDMLFAAIDTTTYTTLRTLFFLSKNPVVQEKLFAEISEHVGEAGTILAPSMLLKLHYLKACIKETNRMNSIVGTIKKTLLKDIVIKGYRIPKGTLILLENVFVSMSSKYIKDPELFKPERWLRSNIKEGVKSHPFLVLPFGFGPRMCIGKRFAEQELYIALIKLVQSFRFEYDGDVLPLKGIGQDKLPKKLNFIIHER